VNPPPGGGTPPTTTPVTTPTTLPPGQGGTSHDAAVPRGYWMLGADGAVYPFGEAKALGSGPAGATAVDVEPTPTGAGYWILSADGRVTPSGGAPLLGNADIGRPSAREQVTSLSATPGGKRYSGVPRRGRGRAVRD